ncbi:GNAT family N-acetyltransferase [Enterovibrio nigricans]|uniref:NADH-dependant formate dehydrogenase delta subunit FdsD n=1 Tax=Enterovibrio nigricans DSM 22720 TaxID=1121868 RepID=A0A1T4VG46_9GAMM|nr:GNAT family N-acetyltransferase [Enterovibrio nigricans]PKF49752.1 GNAT family N-acetyltransferase [Enterovibrio nigricans]SKA63873.1 NADH-dependant formate dehydrogenase delta subunit FdsD [Enterovibrio nigricans DSM 22720]
MDGETHRTQRLYEMANQIADNLEHGRSDDESINEVASHIPLACSEAFAYSLDETVIQHVLTDPNCYLFALFKDGKIAGTVLLFQTGRTLGIHQLGTVRAYRKMGVAAQLMAHSLSFASELGCGYAVLQASKAGIPLYSKLGFEQLATITSVQAVELGR